MSNLLKQLGIVKKYNLEDLKKIEKDIKYWGTIAQSEEIDWNEQIIIEFSKNLYSYWKFLSQNKSIDWSIDFIKQIRECINWDEFSEYFIFSGMYNFKDINLFLKEFKNEINWLKLSKNEQLDWKYFFEHDYDNWNRNIFDEYKKLWSFHHVTLNKSLQKYGHIRQYLIHHHKDKLNWKEISKMKENLFLDIKLIEEFKDKIDWFYLSASPFISDFYKYNNSTFINQFLPYINWSSLAKNVLGKHIIIKYEGYFEGTFYNQLSANNTINFDIELIDRYKDKWDWTKLIENEAIIWDKKKVTLFKEYIFSKTNLENILHNNKEIEIDVEILKEYSNDWQEVYFRGSTKNFDSYLEGLWFIYSSNNKINTEIIYEFGKYLNIATIIKNKNLIWNEELILSILNIEFGDEYQEFKIRNNDDIVYKQCAIDKLVGFKRNRENIIEFMLTQEHIKNILIKSLFKQYFINQQNI